MDPIEALPGPIKGWVERRPKARRALERLSADLDAVASRVEAATGGLQQKVAPWIDPAAEKPAAGPTDDAPTLSPPGNGAPGPRSGPNGGPAGSGRESTP